MRAAAQHHLVDHELAVVLAERALGRAEARVGQIGAARPLPDRAEGIVEQACARGHLPFGFGRQVLAGPAREGIGFVVADVADWEIWIDRPTPAERERMPDAVVLAPIAGRVPAFRLDLGPAVREP